MATYTGKKPKTQKKPPAKSTASSRPRKVKKQRQSTAVLDINLRGVTPAMLEWTLQEVLEKSGPGGGLEDGDG